MDRASTSSIPGGNCQQLSLNDRQWNANLRSTSSPIPRGIYRNSGTTFWSYDFRSRDRNGGSGENDGDIEILSDRLGIGIRTNLLDCVGSPSGINLIVSPDGMRFAWCQSDSIQVYDSKTGERLSELHSPPRESDAWWYFRCGEFGRPGEARPVWSTDSTSLAVFVNSSRGSLYHSHGQVWVWDIESSQAEWRIAIHGELANLNSMVLSAGGRRLLHNAGGCRLLSRVRASLGSRGHVAHGMEKLLRAASRMMGGSRRLQHIREISMS